LKISKIFSGRSTETGQEVCQKCNKAYFRVQGAKFDLFDTKKLYTAVALRTMLAAARDRNRVSIPMEEIIPSFSERYA
jgi:hypothetical protein